MPVDALQQKVLFLLHKRSSILQFPNPLLAHQRFEQDRMTSLPTQNRRLEGVCSREPDLRTYASPLRSHQEKLSHGRKRLRRSEHSLVDKMSHSFDSSNALYLRIIKLYWRCSAKNRYKYPYPLLIRFNFFNCTAEACKRTFVHPN